ncbi:MAG: hypothetical protein LBS69_04760 [Prevotellaceae bacterium]|jgi:hypothetical protein|nr:hypothetical protein [Prevotellaceae bacterium]
MRVIIEIIIIVAIAFFSTAINAQETQRKQGGNFVIIDTTGNLPLELPDYYTGKDIISGAGFSFKKILESANYLKIGNINNVKFDMNPVKSTYAGEEPFRYIWALARFNDKNQIYSSIRDVLGTTIINQFKLSHNSATIGIKFIVNMDGTVPEVEFLLLKNALLFSISPEKLYQLESLLKQRVTFTVDQRSMLDFITGVNISVTIKDL